MPLPQALEPACWAALLKGRKAVLAGDHLQVRWGGGAVPCVCADWGVLTQVRAGGA